jgi:Holliday junction resolvase RusA-like endonuclease
LAGAAGLNSRRPVNRYVGRLSLNHTSSIMPKRKLKVVAKIRNYLVDEVKWKRAIHRAVTKAQCDAGVIYSNHDKLEVEVCFYLTGHKLTKLDIDNRLKQVGDALQGFINDKGALSNGSQTQTNYSQRQSNLPVVGGKTSAIET